MRCGAVRWGAVRSGRVQFSLAGKARSGAIMLGGFWSDAVRLGEVRQVRSGVDGAFGQGAVSFGRYG